MCQINGDFFDRSGFGLRGGGFYLGRGGMDLGRPDWLLSLGGVWGG